MYSRDVGARTKMVVPKLVSVVAMGSGRAAYLDNFGISYQRLFRLRRLVRPCVILGGISRVVCLCSTITVRVIKFRGGVRVQGQTCSGFSVQRWCQIA